MENITSLLNLGYFYACIMLQLAVIILAAGSSSRLGHPKQLIPYTDKNLLQHVGSEALKAIQNVLVVLGSNAEAIMVEMNDLAVQYRYNEDWEEGISSSIRCGLSSVLEYHPLTDAVIFMVTDQPFVSSTLLEGMVSKYQESKKPIVACSYKDIVGVPALFDKQFFPALLELKGQSGAKKIIEQNMDSTLTISFPLGQVDIDTQEDYDSFKKMNSSN